MNSQSTHVQTDTEKDSHDLVKPQMILWFSEHLFFIKKKSTLQNIYTRKNYLIPIDGPSYQSNIFYYFPMNMTKLEVLVYKL